MECLNLSVLEVLRCYISRLEQAHVHDKCRGSRDSGRTLDASHDACLRTVAYAEEFRPFALKCAIDTICKGRVRHRLQSSLSGKMSPKPGEMVVKRLGASLKRLKTQPRRNDMR